MTKHSVEDIEKIREEAKTMKSRYKITKEYGIHHTVIYSYTKDIPTPRQRQPYICGKCLNVLQKILSDGYIFTEKNDNEIRKLLYYLPIIKQSQYKGKSIFNLEYKTRLHYK